MKIAIVSDLHLGYERFYEDAFVQARMALSLASTLADAIILPGDIFDRRNPHPDAIGQGIELFRDLSRIEWKAKVVAFVSYKDAKTFTSVPIIAIPGTHERVAEGSKNPLGLLGLAGLLVDASEATATIEKDGERVSVFGLGGLSEERVKQVISELNPKPIEGNFNIFMFHQSIYELLPFRDEFIHFDDLPTGFDLYVDGHIHNQIVDSAHGKPFIIPGSTVLTQLKDGEQDRKGFFLYDTRTGLFEFKEIESRPFFALHVKFSSATPKEVTSKCEQEIENVLRKSKEKPIIKLCIEGNIASGFKTIDMPTRALHLKFSQSSYIEIENRLVDKEVKNDISAMQEGRLDGLTIKELGMHIFNSKLDEAGFDKGLNSVELFNILSTAKKEKALSEVTKLFESSE